MCRPFDAGDQLFARELGCELVMLRRLGPILILGAGIGCLAIGLYQRAQRIVVEPIDMCTGQGDCGRPRAEQVVGPAYLGWLIAAAVLLLIGVVWLSIRWGVSRTAHGSGRRSQ